MIAQFNPPVPTKREVILIMSEEQAIALKELHGILSDSFVIKQMVTHDKQEFENAAVQIHNALYNSLDDLLTK